MRAQSVGVLLAVLALLPRVRRLAWTDLGPLGAGVVLYFVLDEEDRWPAIGALLGFAAGAYRGGWRAELAAMALGLCAGLLARLARD